MRERKIIKNSLDIDNTTPEKEKKNVSEGFSCRTKCPNEQVEHSECVV
jgi:hypothetical protein